MGTPADHTIPASPPVPAVVRVYGRLVEFLSILLLVSALFVTLLRIAALGTEEGSLASVLRGLLGLAVSLVFARLGRGLSNGERLAVLAWCILGGLPALSALLATIFAIIRGEVLFLLLPIAVCVIYVPPIVSAFRHWSAFKTTKQRRREAAEVQERELKREEERRDREQQEQEAREQQRILSQEYPCSTCSHFVRTGILDRFKGKCTRHEKVTYSTYHCPDHSLM